MLPTPINYRIYPSVVLAGCPTEMTVVPTERTFLFFEGQEYTLRIFGMNYDEPNYHETEALDYVTVKATGGVLRFTYTFETEQQYRVQLMKDDTASCVMPLYALREDLYGLTPLRGDFHTHSFRSDGKRDPSALAGHFREQNYDCFALTDHNRFYPGGEIDEVYAGVNCGITRVLGEEVHAPGSIVHIIHVGGKKSVAAQYINDREGYERGVAECMTRVPDSVPEKYRARYAMAMWVTDRIHEAGGFAIFPHPYWTPASRIYNVNDEFATILLTSGMFDGYELIGGMKQEENNRSVALWNDLRAEGLDLTVVGSSDVHGITAADTFPHYFTILFAEQNENDSIIDALRAHRSVAVEANGCEYDRQYRCYGSLRLVSYAQFLLKYFFSERQRIASGEGVAMRAYAMNQAPAALIELQAELAANFRDEFFGRRAPTLPDADMIAFVDKWRTVQIEQGPVTKGSVIDSDKITRNL